MKTNIDVVQHHEAHMVVVYFLEVAELLLYVNSHSSLWLVWQRVAEELLLINVMAFHYYHDSIARGIKV